VQCFLHIQTPLVGLHSLLKRLTLCSLTRQFFESYFEPCLVSREHANLVPSFAKAHESRVSLLQIGLRVFFAASKQFNVRLVGYLAHANRAQVRWLANVLRYACSALHETRVVYAMTQTHAVAKLVRYGPSNPGEPQALQIFGRFFVLDLTRKLDGFPHSRPWRRRYLACRIMDILLYTHLSCVIPTVRIWPHMLACKQGCPNIQFGPVTRSGDNTDATTTISSSTAEIVIFIFVQVVVHQQHDRIRVFR
jgi:hypothetical protein